MSGENGAYVLTWNPGRWPWPERLDEARRVRQGEPVRRWWSIANRNTLPTGSRLYLLKQGDGPKGIIGSGHAVAPATTRPHYDAERAARGDTAQFTWIEFDHLLDHEAGAILQHRTLTDPALASVAWHTQSSGMRLAPEAAQALDARWLRFLTLPIASATGNIPSPADGDASEGVRFREGATTVAIVNRYERDPAARAACIAHHGTGCHVCGIDFGEVFGELGRGFIHVHHLELVSTGERDVDPVRDLRPVCPNCHAMLHRRNPPLSIDELWNLLNTAR